jgi:transglycosylase-like protein with SLT domain
MAGLLDMTTDDGDTGDLATFSTEAAPAPAAAPDAAPAPAPATDDRASLASRIGLAIAGGDPGLFPLNKEQRESVGTRSLLNFGLSLLANSGPSYERHTLAQIVGAGLQSAGSVPGAEEQILASQAATKSGLNLKAAELALREKLGVAGIVLKGGQLDVARTLANLKLQELKLAQLKLTGPASSADAGMRGFGGAGAGPPPDALVDPGPTASAEDVAKLPDVAALPDATRQHAITAMVESGMGINEAAHYARMIAGESGGQQYGPTGETLASPKGALGAGQVIPSTFADMAKKYAIKGTVDDPAANLRAGARYFHEGVTDPNNGGLFHATIRYNAGPAGLDRYVASGQLPAETKKYLISTGALPPGGGGGGGGRTAAAPGGGTGDGPPEVYPGGGRGTIRPGDKQTGTGTEAPPVPADWADLPAPMRAGFVQQLAAAKYSEGGVAAAWKDINDQIAKFHAIPRFHDLSQEDAQRRYGSAFSPTAIYKEDQFGNTQVVQQGQPGVNPEQTREGRMAQMTLDQSKGILDQHAKAAAVARSSLNSLSAMHSLSNQFGADPIGERYPLVNKALLALPGGTAEQRSAMTASQAFDGLVSLVSTQLRAEGTGRLSNQEMDRFLHALPAIGDSQQSRALKIGVLTAISDRIVKENQIAQAHFNRPGGNGNMNGLDDELDKLGEVIPTAPPPPTAGMTPEAHTAAAQARAAFAARLRPGMLYNDENGHYAVYQPRGGR